MVGSLAGMIAGGLAALSKGSGAVTSTVDPKREERERAKKEKARLEALFSPPRYRPNTLWMKAMRWNRVAWVFPQKREAARRVRQHEARFQKALDRTRDSLNMDDLAEFG